MRAAPAPAAERTPVGGPARGLFVPLSWGLVRLPLLPVERRPSGGGGAGVSAGAGAPAEAAAPGAGGAPGTGDSLLPADPLVRTAIAVASPDLYAALERTRAGDGAAAERVARKLRRYLIRMATRPTPYGLFAGVGLVSWGSTASLRLGDRTRLRTRTRLDMGWLLDLVAELEAEPEVRRRLRLVANPALLLRAGRVFTDGASLRATLPVRRALAAAARPVEHEALVAELLAGGGDRARVEGLIGELLARDVLLSDLRPPLTGSDPAEYVLDRLAGAGPADRDRLGALVAAVRALDAVALEQRAAQASAVTRRLREARPPARTGAPSVSVLAVDARAPLLGSELPPAVAREAAAAAELLLRLSPHPDGLPYLSAYRRAFAERYGAERAVPLLELLDPRFGLGPPDALQAPHPPKSPGAPSPAGEVAWARRDQALLDLALSALRDRRTAIELDDDALATLETWPPHADAAPVSLDVAVFVAAASAAAVEAGKFRIVVSPNVGAHGAGRNTGRFADLLGPAAIAGLREAAWEEAESTPGVLRAELVYAPEPRRLANVAIRPVVLGHQLAVDAPPGVRWKDVVPLSELVVDLRDDRLRVSWPAAGAELVAVQGHMLNPVHAPAAARFLLDVSGGQGVQLWPFDWGPAAAFPFLPRVQRGRIVLSPAQWRLPAGAAGRGRLTAWRKRWSVPSHVYLAEHDNRLLLDLDDPEAEALLREEAAARPGPLLLQEALPGPADAWVPGPGGHHLLELVVPVVRRRAPAPLADRFAANGADRSVRHPASAPARPAARLRPPGSEWLYLKLYCPAEVHDELIVGPVRDFAGFAASTGLIDAWFFVRYADPEPHLRIRFHGDPPALLGQALAGLTGWAGRLVAEGLCSRFSLETYERELERFGGPRGTALAEAVFAADSALVAGLLALGRAHSDRLEPLVAAALSVDQLLAGLGLDRAQRRDWYAGHAALTRTDGAEYRRLRPSLEAVLRDGPPHPEPARLLAIRRDALAPLGAELAAGAAGVPLPQLYADYVHLHCNRLLTLGSELEPRVLAALRRAAAGLEHTRARPPR